MNKGISLHIGLNKVDKNHYRGATTEDPWEGKLKACEADAKAMFELAKGLNFKAELLLTPNATRANVKEKIQAAATALNEEGGYFFITYSGHGGQVMDESGDEKNQTDSNEGEEDTEGKDETWCLFDAQLIDDELYDLWTSFSDKVRIIIFSDSCHSGTIAKSIGGEEEEPVAPEGRAYRLAPKASLASTYLAHWEFYDSLQSPVNRKEVVASIMQISATQDSELAIEIQDEDPPHGVFTKAVMNAFGFTLKSYGGLFERILDAVTDLNPEQTPNMVMFGKEDPSFIRSKPLSLSED